MFSRTAEEVALSVSGDFQITHPKVVEYIPKIGLEGFTIYKPSGDDSKWAFRLEGGSVEINKSIDLFGVARADIKDIGMGKRDEDGESWNVFTFSGGVQLLEGIDAGAWVEGLRIPWRMDPLEVKGISLDGVEIQVVIPDTLAFIGSAKHKKEGGTEYFEGGIGLYLFPVEFEFGAGFKVGKNPQCRFAFLSAFLKLPGPGIALGSLPLFFRGMKGLIGINVTPDADEIAEYFPLVSRAPAGLEHPQKWRGQCGSHAIGVGVLLATADGKTFNMSALFAYFYPELLLLIEGQAFILEAPKPGKKPPFHSLIVLDIDEPAALVNISAQYEFVKGVLNANGMCEAYFGPDPSNPGRTTSYFALGQVKPYFPVDRPVNAKVLQLFNANSYLILKPSIWALGASIGLSKKKIDLYFASINFEALIKGTGELNWGPEQFKGDLNLAGNVSFRIFKKGFDLSLTSHVLGMTPDWLVDALLRFAIKFKILWKKFKYEGELPFHWERRITPPIPELLDEIILQHAVADKTVTPYIQQSCDSLPPLENIPEVEPDTIPALAFNYPMNDYTGYAFGQDVSGPITHRSGDYEFTAELPGGEEDNRGIEMSRMKINDWPGGSWKHFKVNLNLTETTTSDEQPLVLYGAWQATQAPDGTKGRIHLHLFVRTPFDYNRHNRLQYKRAAVMFKQMHHTALNGETQPTNSSESIAAINNAAQSMLVLNTPATVTVPLFKEQLKNFDDLRAQNKPLPLQAVQYAVNEDPSFPRTGTIETTERCQNFLTTRPGYYRPDELIYLAEDITLGNKNTKEPSGNILLGGFGHFNIPSRLTPVVLGNCEIFVDHSFPYPLQFLHVHSDKGLDKDGKLVSVKRIKNKSFFKIAFRYPIRRLALHYEGTSEIKQKTATVEVPNLRFHSAYSAEFSAERFWQFRNRLHPSPSVEWDNSQITISSADTGPSFNEVLFIVFGDTRIFSLCFKIDHTQDLNDKEDILKNFIDITWPDKDGKPGPKRLKDPIMKTPEGNIIPGYIYRLKVLTCHSRSGRQAGGPREDHYCAFFKVVKLPSDLKPYILTLFPKDKGFPHYRAHEYYIRFNRNYVHKLMGDENNKLTWKILSEGHPITNLPFRDDPFREDPVREDLDADLNNFLQDTDPNRKGWGWGKANGHVLTTEEQVWMEAYNQSVSSGGISEDMAIPDDMMWAYPVNPVMMRADFSDQDGVSGGSTGIPFFQNPISVGLPSLNQRWAVCDGLLYHTAEPVTGTSETLAVSDSFLLTQESFSAPYILSLWLRPQSDTGRVGIVIAANQNVTRYLLIVIDMATQRIQLIRRDTARDPQDQIWSDKKIGLGKGRWSRIFVRLVAVSGQLAVTVDLADQALLSVPTDLPSNLPNDELYAGLFTNSNYQGTFDNLEILSTDRLNELPGPLASHHLSLYYQGQDQTVEMYKKPFFTSQYIDLFDHLNSWDRKVWRSRGTATTDDNVVLQAVDNWVTSNVALITALGKVDLNEREYAAKRLSLEDVEASRKRLREARFNLDEKFESVVNALGFELPARPERFEFIRADNGKGLLILYPEPIDWSRLLSVPLKPEVAGGSGTGTSYIRTQLIYRSDFTSALLLLRPSETSLGTFVQGQTYLWTIKQYDYLDNHPTLNWLQGWVTHRQEQHQLTLEMPVDPGT
jgi:hypothetical protein